MKNYLSFFISLCFLLCLTGNEARAQQYKIRQVTTVMNMKSESTVYVKAMRKRTETTGMMGMPNPPINIEQCDRQRTIKINDKKKLYYIEPFGKEEVIDADAKTAAVVNTKPAVQGKEKSVPQMGGVISMWYNITDTGERKKINGFTARHLWTTQKIKPSPDACMMKDSMIMKTDGWYIDLPQFNCPVRYTPSANMPEKNQPDCKDRFVTRRSGKGKLGFPLSETRTIIMGDGAKNTTFETNMETLEFSTATLDSMLFEIPPGYQQAANEAELQDKFDMNAMINQVKENNYDKNNSQPINPEHKTEGNIRIGVYEPTGDGQADAPSLQKHLAGILNGGKIEAIAIASEEEAKKYHCDYSLTTGFEKIKQAGKVGGLLKAIKNADPNAASSYNIETAFTLKSLADGSVLTQPKINGKYEGKVNEAAKRALDEGSRQVLKAIK